MKRIHLVLFAVVLTAAAVAVAAHGQVRGPILILGNSDFTAENGVRSGSGTASDPYMISGWEIDVPSDGRYGVLIENVSAAFVLKGLVIRGAHSVDGAAIRIGFASGGRIEGCAVSNSMHGIEVVSSETISMSNCVFYVSGRGMRVLGESAADFRHSIDGSNQINNHPILYYVGLDGETIAGQRGAHMTVADSRNVTITGNEIVNGDGILLAFVDGGEVVGNAVYRTSPVWTDHGIHLYRSTGLTVRENSLRNNRLAGIQLSLAWENEILENQVLANDTGIRLVGADENRIDENILFANVTAIELTGGASGNSVIGNVIYHENTKRGIHLELSMANRIERNALTNCEIGIVVEADASNNAVRANTIVAGAYGMTVSGSFNEFVENLITQQNRGILFPEAYGRSLARGNLFRGNVLADNGHQIYVNLDSEGNRFTGNTILGAAQRLVEDRGTGNRWAVDGVGNYWGGADMVDRDGDGFSDLPVTVYPAAVEDTAPLMSPRSSGGILSTMDEATIVIETAGGETAEIPILRADAGYERWIGFRGFPAALLDGFPGILFVFDDEAERRFTMVTVPFDLDIAFFDAEGRLVGTTVMTANSDDLYTAREPFRYALELPRGRLGELGIGAGARLRIL